MQKSKQKLIILYGSHNTGKTYLSNLFAKEDNFKCLDLYKQHYSIWKEPLIEIIGEENLLSIEDQIIDGTIFSIDIFFKVVGKLMNQFPDYNFLIKPGPYEWMQNYNDIFDDMVYEMKHFMPVKRKHIHFLHASRHPKISLATAYDHNTDMNEFVERWSTLEYYLKICPEVYQIINVEHLGDYPLMRKLLKKVDFDNLISYTDFDINEYRTNIFERFDQFKVDLKVIDAKLQDIMKYLGYESKDKNLKPYLKALYKITDLKIKRRCPNYEID